MTAPLLLSRVDHAPRVALPPRPAASLPAAVSRLAAASLPVWLLLLAVLLLGGCSSPRAYLGEALTKVAPDQGYRAAPVLATRPADDILFIVSLSGGGMRASTMAYAIFEQLAADTVQLEGKPVRMLDEVDLISAVSGGAVTAAYYTLYGDRLFRDFERRFLRTDVDAALKRRILLDPRNWLRMASVNFTRGDVYAQYFDGRMFRGATFADLDRSGARPFLVINATDLALSSRFEFTQDTFDLLCSDLDRYPLARAVAASSAVPALLAPITLRNYAGRCDYRLPSWVADAAADEKDLRRHFRANVMQRQANPAYAYLHLVDGALSDNLGVRSTLDALADDGDSTRLQDFLSTGKRRKLVFLSLNAGNSNADRISSTVAPPTIFEMLRLVGTIPVDRYSLESTTLLRETLQEWARRLDGSTGDNLYYIDIDLQSLSVHPRYGRLTRLPTTFSANDADIDDLRCATRELLLDSADYQRLLRDTAANFAERCSTPR